MINYDVISRQEVLEEIRKNPEKPAEEIIKEMQPTDTDNYGYWIPCEYSGWKCSHCGRYSTTMSRYCPECGFRLKEKEKNKRRNKEK